MKKKHNKQGQYDEMRQLLEGKEQFDFMQLPYANPILEDGPAINEEIIEQIKDRIQTIS